MGATEAVVAGLSYLRMAQQSRARNKELSAQHALQERQILESRRIEERRRGEELRAGQGTQRARFGAMGLTSGAGSASAVLAGLSRKSARDRQDADRLTALRQQGLSYELSAQRRKNLLEPSNYLFTKVMDGVEYGGNKLIDKYFPNSILKRKD